MWNLDSYLIYDCEVFKEDWIIVFKELTTGLRTIIHNDNEAVMEFMKGQPVLCGFNNKHYDNHILKAIMLDMTPAEIKQINDTIIVHGINGWEIPTLKDSGIWFESFDLMDDTQQGTSLKSIEAHLGIPIEETQVDFDIDRRLTEQEVEDTIKYCSYDVDATEKLFYMREAYLKNKLKLGRMKGLSDTKALYMTNARLTATYLGAKQPKKPWEDERDYQYPKELLREYIPQEVFDFFDKLHDPNVPDAYLFGGYDEKGTKKKGASIEIMVGVCPTTIAFGGIHGAIPTYMEEATETRSIRNKDVASYYPSLMVKRRYCSRNMPDPDFFNETLQTRFKAKKAGDKETANALKLVLNTTYGAMLNGKDGVAYNDLYDPLMGRSVCITGQLFLLELSVHLVRECPSLKIIQLNTDGIMVSLDNEDEPKWQEITQEWQDRTGFALEEDFIKKIIQKDVNNYIEIPEGDGDPKIKGVALFRGISAAGAWKINNNATIVPKAVIDYFSKGIDPEETIYAATDILDFQMISKVGGTYSRCFQIVDGEEVAVQRVNRVYACTDWFAGTLYQQHAKTRTISKVSGLPAHCIIDNNNKLSIDVVDRDWYVRLAKRYINDFRGVTIKRNSRKVNKIMKEALALFEEKENEK